MLEDDCNQWILEENIYDEFDNGNNNNNNNNSEEVVDDEDENDGIDELEEMNEIEWEQVLDSTAEVHKTVTKVQREFICIYFGNTLLIIG